MAKRISSRFLPIGKKVRVDAALCHQSYRSVKSKFGSLEVSESRRLRSLEEETARLKKLLAEAMLDNAVLKDLASKEW